MGKRILKGRKLKRLMKGNDLKSIPGSSCNSMAQDEVELIAEVHDASKAKGKKKKLRKKTKSGPSAVIDLTKILQDIRNNTKDEKKSWLKSKNKPPRKTTNDQHSDDETDIMVIWNSLEDENKVSVIDLTENEKDDDITEVAVIKRTASASEGSEDKPLVVLIDDETDKSLNNAEDSTKESTIKTVGLNNAEDSTKESTIKTVATNVENLPGCSKVGQITQENKTVKNVPDPVELCRMYIARFPASTTVEDLKQYFQKWGEIVHVEIVTNPETSRSREFGFITFCKKSSVDEVQKNRPHILDGKLLLCRRHLPRKDFHHPGGLLQKLLVPNLKPEITKEELEKYFKQFGKITNCSIMSYNTGRTKFAFLSFTDYDAVDKILVLRGHKLPGQFVEPVPCLSREQLAEREMKYYLKYFGGFRDWSISAIERWIKEHPEICDQRYQQNFFSQTAGFSQFNSQNNISQNSGFNQHSARPIFQRSSFTNSAPRFAPYTNPRAASLRPYETFTTVHIERRIEQSPSMSQTQDTYFSSAQGPSTSRAQYSSTSQAPGPSTSRTMPEAIPSTSQKADDKDSTPMDCEVKKEPLSELEIEEQKPPANCCVDSDIKSEQEDLSEDSHPTHFVAVKSEPLE